MGVRLAQWEGRSSTAAPRCRPAAAPRRRARHSGRQPTSNARRIRRTSTQVQRIHMSQSPRRRFVLLLVCWLVSAFAPRAFAQSDTAQVIGAVRDAQGGAIEDATIAVLNVDTGFLRAVTTDADGRYRVTAIPPGRYS